MHEEQTHKVTVWGKPHEVTVYRESKAVWIATGRYMDKPIEVKGQTAMSAIKLWRSTATYKPSEPPQTDNTAQSDETATPDESYRRAR
jgi:hypothetical protein